nr:MAG TPA: hypothetical protein [Bacteriophage sp.]DAI57811.1 MAG TPA: hypothetical protein [Caudoviricetes sp.]DAV54059.1 MAG TPA: hypothetical protein [Caudoviricetes sp.]
MGNTSRWILKILKIYLENDLELLQILQKL